MQPWRYQERDVLGEGGTALHPLPWTLPRSLYNTLYNKPGSIRKCFSEFCELLQQMN